jgi:hypothetical protein
MFGLEHYKYDELPFQLAFLLDGNIPMDQLIHAFVYNLTPLASFSLL